MIPPAGVAFLFALVATAAATGWLRGWLLRRRVLDIPNHRSSHDNPTPRGGGLAVTGVLLAAWAAVAALVPAAPQGIALVLAAAAALAAISWVDDLKGLGAAPRFAAQGVAVALGLAALPPGLVFQGLLPEWADAGLSLLAWLWFVNLFNFMDGIDGIAGTETACIGLGLAILAMLGGDAARFALAAALIGAALGFLWWNRHPARIFLGDVGSVPLGFLLGWLLLSEAAAGRWAPALILPLYYLADATITLLRRLLRGEKVWQAHRQHFYQRAAQGAGHAAVVRAVLLADLALVALAVASGAAPWPASALAGLAVAVLLAHLARLASRRPKPA